MIDTDIAFNKPAYSSSAFGYRTHSFGAQLVNNGKVICDNEGGPIAHTKTEDSPWFKVDLRGTFNIETVAVIPRTSKFSR